MKEKRKRVLGIILICVWVSFAQVIAFASENTRSQMVMSENGYSLIKQFEGCRLTAYKAVSTETYYTIGWGHYGSDVYKGMTITQAQADAYLVQDVASSQTAVNTFLNKNGISIGQNQYDALVSFTYNLGNVWVSTSTFQLKTILKNGYQNYTDSQIRTAFTNWNKSGGNVLAGLTRRRNAEADLFLTGKGETTDACSCSDSYAGNYTVTTSQLPLTIRSGHGSSYGKVGSIPKGTTVYVSKANGSWAHVTYNGISGYCSMEYLSKQEIPKPSNPTISKNQDWYDLNDTIEITAYADNATKYYMSMYKDDQKIVEEYVEGGKYVLKASVYGTGKYSAYFSGINDAGYVDTPWVDCYVVGEPEYAYIQASAKTYNLSDTVTLSLSAGHTKWQVIGIDKIGTGRIITENTGETYSIAASKLGAGKYSSYFSAYNGSGYTDTSAVEFSILCDNHSYTSEITKQPTCTTTGEKVFTCTVCGESRTETILATGHQHTEIRNAKSATAEQDGYTGDTYCKDCNTKLSSGTVIKKLSVTGKASLSEVTAGNSVTITATASGGKSGYTYSFLIHNLETDKWFRVAEFGKSNQYVWTASGSGNREFFAEVKDSDGTVIRSEAVKVTVKAKSVPLSVSGKVSAAEVTSGKTVTISANAAGGTGSYTYSFLIHNLENDTWYRWSFDKNAQHVWTASGSGNREFFAEAKDSAGTVIRSSAMKVTVKKTATPLTITGKVSAAQVSAGNTVTISASAAGGTGSYTYSFLIHNLENDSWYRWAFDKNAQYVWTASGSGSREFFAEAKDSAGTVVRSAAMKVTVASGSTGTLQIQASADKNQVTVGSAVTVKALATGGSGSYTYSFLVHNQANDSWYRFGDFAAASSYTWTAGNAGTREFFVEVKDGNGTVVRSSAVIVNVK